MKRKGFVRSAVLIVLIVGLISATATKATAALVGVPPRPRGSDPWEPRPESLAGIGIPHPGFQSAPAGGVPSSYVAWAARRPFADGSMYWPRQRGHRFANPSPELGWAAASTAGTWQHNRYFWRQANPFAAVPVGSSPQTPNRFSPEAGGRFLISAVASGRGPAFGRASAWDDQVGYESPWPATTPGYRRPGLPKPRELTNGAACQFPATSRDGRR